MYIYISTVNEVWDANMGHFLGSFLRIRDVMFSLKQRSGLAILRETLLQLATCISQELGHSEQAM